VRGERDPGAGRPQPGGDQKPAGQMTFTLRAPPAGGQSPARFGQRQRRALDLAADALVARRPHAPLAGALVGSAEAIRPLLELLARVGVVQQLLGVSGPGAPVHVIDPPCVVASPVPNLFPLARLGNKIAWDQGRSSTSTRDPALTSPLAVGIVARQSAPSIEVRMCEAWSPVGRASQPSSR